MKFCDIPGNTDAKDRLRHLADINKIPHALLIEGPEGVGKHALARAFLQYAACSNRTNGDSCGVCPNCRQHQSMQHIDTIYTFPYVKKKNASTASPTLSSDYLDIFTEFVKDNPFMDSVKWLEKLGSPNTQPTIFVEEANELIRRLSYASHSMPYTAVIMWQVDKLNESASNKLLKLIEEPPGNSVIVMTSDSPNTIIPTIYSRTQRIKVKRLSDSEIAEWLNRTSDLSEDEAAEIASLSEGSITNALRIMSGRSDSVRFLDYFISLMRSAYKRDIAALKDWSQNLASEKRDTVIDFLEYTARMIRENFIANLNKKDLNLMTAKELEFSKNFARFIHIDNVEELFAATSKAISDVRANVNAKIVLFDFAITVILKLKQ